MMQMERKYPDFLSELPMRVAPSLVWRTYMGGKLLAAWRGLAPQPDGHFPEDWICSTTRAQNPGREEIQEGDTLVLANDGHSRRTVALRQLLEDMPEAYLGARHMRRFGAEPELLVKLLDSAIRLPIQAHPGREKAQRLFGSRHGKTESWYVLDTRGEIKHPYVLLGFRPGVTREQWRKAYREQDIPAMCGMLHKLEVRKGEMYLVEPGVPHAIGEGCLLVETQEPSDLVFRTEKKNAAGQLLSDEVCSMGIGVDAMMDCFVYRGADEQETRRKYQVRPTMQWEREEGSLVRLIGPEQTDCFEVVRLSAARMVCWQPDRFAVCIVENGGGLLRCSAGSVRIRAGETWLLPAGITELRWEPAGSLETVICLPPK